MFDLQLIWKDHKTLSLISNGSKIIYKNNLILNIMSSSSWEIVF